MAKQSSTENAEFWKLVIAEQVASGPSIRAFCRKQLLSKPSFHAWKRMLRERAQPIESPLLTHRSNCIRFEPVRCNGIWQRPIAQA